jgi:3-isopropylmalate dehydrogenase
MFEYAFSLMDEGKAIRDAVAASMTEGFVTEDIAEGQAYKTSEVGDWIAHWIEK